LRVKISLTPKEGKYLTFMYRKQVEEDKRASTTILAKSFKVNPATATETLQKLDEKKLITYTRYYGAELTEKGIVEAQKLLRKHRILEVLFVKFLRYDTKKACEEASKIDHYCSEDLINTICRTYEHPDTCPCSKEIFQDSTCMGR
jgi:DtxR family Mn-dependent transcriptional regulator